MFKIIAVLSLMVNVVYAADYEEMYQNSYVVDCNGFICVDVVTGGEETLDVHEGPINGKILRFRKEYSFKDTRDAIPYLIRRYREDNQ